MKEGGFEVIHVNFSPARVDPVYFPQAEVVGDIANSVWQILTEIKPQSHWDFSGFIRIRDALRQNISNNEQRESVPMTPQQLVCEVAEVMGGEGLLSLDNGLYKIWFARNFKATQRNGILLDNALASMGAGLPVAMAASMVHPDKPVLAICGDGGFMMNSQELETAVRLKLNIVILLLRDDGYGMIRWKQEAMEMEDYGLKFNNPDFVLYAQSYGAAGHRVQKTDELKSLIKQGLEEGGVHLIDVPVDYTDSSDILLNQVKQLSAEL